MGQLVAEKRKGSKLNRIQVRLVCGLVIRSRQLSLGLTLVATCTPANTPVLVVRIPNIKKMLID